MPYSSKQGVPVLVDSCVSLSRLQLDSGSAELHPYPGVWAHPGYSENLQKWSQNQQMYGFTCVRV